ncbi:MAG: 2-amino-4-hydroxy-6-hydroxymethyldihydropteridine diphosphokinase [Spirochaetales bacterium]|jgi:2-amino-4-hydroxy-6-hydroxymethyldihydropteridine diphosphokinase|nr:2-amino-4-hydroxy-6-hydroxymethyldihydropteridine diphosphokinase [Spirochaetales bacterium]
MDKIFIRDLAVNAIIGINDWERVQEQPILINVTLFGDISAVGSSDNLEEGVNYRTVAKKLIAHTQSAQRFTVEALATDLARLCLEEEGVQKVTMRVEKPGAVRYSESVGVEIERTREQLNHTVCLLLGSNIEGERNLVEALNLLKGEMTLLESSAVYHSPAVGSDGPDFLNAALLAMTPLSREALKEEVFRPIEAKLKRVRTADKNAPRTIDIDLITYDGEVVDPTLWDYGHIALPVGEILPSHMKIKEVAMALAHSSAVVRKEELSSYPFATKFNKP